MAESTAAHVLTLDEAVAKVGERIMSRVNTSGHGAHSLIVETIEEHRLRVDIRTFRQSVRNYLESTYSPRELSDVDTEAMAHVMRTD